MPVNSFAIVPLLVLPLLGGVLFITNAPYIKYIVRNFSGQWLILWAALAGVLLLAIAHLVVVFAISPIWAESPNRFASLWNEIFPAPYSLSFTLAFLLGCLPWVLFTLLAWCPYTSKKVKNLNDKMVGKAIKRFGNGAENLFYEATKGKQQISITTKSGKVYIGYIIRRKPVALHSDSSYVGILPTASGYRDAVTKKMELTTDYRWIREKGIAVNAKEETAHSATHAEEEAANSVDKDMVFAKYFPFSEIAILSRFNPNIDSSGFSAEADDFADKR